MLPLATQRSFRYIPVIKRERKADVFISADPAHFAQYRRMSVPLNHVSGVKGSSLSSQTL